MEGSVADLLFHYSSLWRRCNTPKRWRLLLSSFSSPVRVSNKIYRATWGCAVKSRWPNLTFFSCAVLLSHGSEAMAVQPDSVWSLQWAKAHDWTLPASVGHQVYAAPGAGSSHATDTRPRLHRYAPNQPDSTDDGNNLITAVWPFSHFLELIVTKLPQSSELAFVMHACSSKLISV